PKLPAAAYDTPQRSIGNYPIHAPTLFCNSYGARQHLHSFPTRRSSDLDPGDRAGRQRESAAPAGRRDVRPGEIRRDGGQAAAAQDRKSTRLNSSHVEISYAVICLKKKQNKGRYTPYAKHASLEPWVRYS